MKKKLLVGNWKLNHTRGSARDFFSALLPQIKRDGPKLVIAPVAVMLSFVHELLAKHSISLGAQNVFYAEKGAYTGEYSAEQLLEVGVSYCIVGHSERRALFHETDDMVQKKALACIKAGIKPIICVGETEKERALGQTEAVIERQVSLATAGLKAQDDVVIAYEPVWAIGTGKTASKNDVHQVHGFIRSLLKKNFDEGLASRSAIIYGGSVTPQNIREICLMPDVDGALVGGASLQAASFLSMVEELYLA